MNVIVFASTYRPQLGLSAWRGLTRRTPRSLGLPPSGQGVGGYRRKSAPADQRQLSPIHKNYDNLAFLIKPDYLPYNQYPRAIDSALDGIEDDFLCLCLCHPCRQL